MKKIPYNEIILVIIGTLLYFFANVQRVAVPGAVFDVMQHDLSVSAKAITALGTTFMYVYAVSQLIIGVLIARIGGFMVISFGAIIFFVGCILFPLSANLMLLYLSRVLIGFGSASFYLGLISETRKIVDSRNFGMVLSMILFIGYLGGIFANAPLVVCIHQLGWRQAFFIIALVVMLISAIYSLINSNRPLPKINNSVKLNLDLFKEVLKNRKNIFLYLCTGINYGIFFVLLTVIGKKFLEDFCHVSEVKAAIFLSVASALYALAGPIIAYLSKIWYYQKVIFLKFATLNTFISMFVILTCLILDIKSEVICYLLCSIAILSNLSALSIPLLHDYNSEKIATTSVSILTFTYYIMVGFLGSVVGLLLDMFTKISNSMLSSSKAIIYSNDSYIAIFLTLLVFSIVAFISSFMLEETKTTQKLINWYHHHHHD